MPPASVAPPAWGVQEPRIASWPAYVSSAGDEAVDLARMAGLHLDPWQQYVLKHALGERPGGKWAAFEVGLVVSRQNGKGSLLEARELAGLFLLDERLVIHSAHQFDTSLEAFQRLLHLVENTPDLSRRVKRVSRSHGEEGIQLTNGQRIRFRTRTKGGGRGFTCDCLILDEAMILPESTVGALLPTLSARPNPQVWYTGSAVDQDVHDQGMSLARVRKRGVSGADPNLAYFEFSPDVRIEHADDVSDDFEAWRQSNPALGFRISAEHIERERVAMDPKTFAVERLGIGDWPDPDAVNGQAISLNAWMSCTDQASKANDPVCLAFDVRPDRGYAAIAAAGRRPDGLAHIEVIDHKSGTGWVVDRLDALAKHKPLAVVCDAAGPAASLLAECEKRGIDVTVVSAKDHAQACGLLFDGVDQKTLRHLGTPELAAAIKGAVKRPLGDAWAWSRKSSAVDISPLVACTLALWGIGTQAQKAPPRFINLAEV
jgi:hypothetical protein